MSDTPQFLDSVVKAALAKLRADPIPLYTFALYHDHESAAVSVCADTKESSLASLRRSNNWSMRYFAQHVRDGKWEDACLFQANVGRSLSLGDFARVNVARTDLPPGVATNNSFYLAMVGAIVANQEYILELAPEREDVIFCCSGPDSEVALAWSVLADKETSMSALESVLVRLKSTLPSAAGVTEENLYKLDWAIEEVLGIGGKVITLDDGSSASLPADQRAFFDALVYFQCISGLLSTIAGDGFLSIFYNETGAGIEQTRRTLEAFGDPIAPVFEEAYQMLRAPYDIQPNTNWVTRNSGDPYEVIGDEDQKAVRETETQIEKLSVQAWARALTMYKAAR